MMTLEEIKIKVATYQMPPAEKRAQRVSLILGLRSNESKLTPEAVLEMLDGIEGHDTRPK